MKLKVELTDAKYIGKTNQECVDMLNDPIIDEDQMVPMRALTAYLLRKKRLRNIEDESKTNVLNVAEECYAFMFMANNVNFNDMDLNDADTIAILAAIKGAGLLNDTNQSDILAMATKKITRAQQIGHSKVELGHVEGARA